MPRAVKNVLSGTVIAVSKVRPAVHRLSNRTPITGTVDVTVDVGNGVSIVGSVRILAAPLKRPPPEVGDRVELEFMPADVLVRREPDVVGETDAPPGPEALKEPLSGG